MITEVSHDAAVQHVRAHADSWHEWNSAEFAAELRYVADVADAVKRLEEALRAMLSATAGGHYSHWDPLGAAGNGCRACRDRNEAADVAYVALASIPKEPT